jgi:carbonic anhydrase
MVLHIGTDLVHAYEVSAGKRDVPFFRIKFQKKGCNMNNFRLFLMAALVVAWSNPSLAQHWGYSGEAGPENWSKLEPEFAMCGEGRNQSPIDLRGFIEAELKPLQMDYQDGATEILNNGHAIQVNYASGSVLTVDGHSFELKQFHFHSPSENTIEGKSFPIECHLVHSDKDGNLAVVAIMFEEGSANPLLEKLWAKMPSKEGGKAGLSEKHNVTSLLPTDRDYYRFNGSLTTPPCSEGVWWLVLKSPVNASKDQVQQFSTTMGFANNRPVHPVNARPILE